MCPVNFIIEKEHCHSSYKSWSDSLASPHKTIKAGGRQERLQKRQAHGINDHGEETFKAFLALYQKGSSLFVDYQRYYSRTKVILAKKS